MAKTMSKKEFSAAVESALSHGYGVSVGEATDAQLYKAVFHTKAKMMTPEQLEEYVGHQIGGVCPFGIKDGVDVYLDESLKRFNTVFPACGSSNSAIELTIPQLEEFSNFKVRGVEHNMPKI